MKVKNMPGTSGERCECGCGSWRAHWEKWSDVPWPERCQVTNCDGIAEDGAHVKTRNGWERIAPLCKAHNHPENSAAFELRDERMLQPTSRFPEGQHAKEITRIR